MRDAKGIPQHSLTQGSEPCFSASFLILSTFSYCIFLLGWGFAGFWFSATSTPGIAPPQRQGWLYGLVPRSSSSAPRRAPRRHQTTRWHPTGPGKTSTNTNACLSAPSHPSHYPHPSPHQKTAKITPSPQTGFGNHRTPAAILIMQQQPHAPRCPQLPGTFAPLLCKKKPAPRPSP